MAIFTPAAMARATELRWASMVSVALAMTWGASSTPRSAASRTPIGAISVGTSQVPAANIISMVSSSR